MVLFAVAIIGKALHTQIKDGDALRIQAEELSTKKETLLPERGNIYSEDGTLLSSTIPQFDLRVDFKAIKKDTFEHYVDTLAKCMASVFKNGSAADYKQEMRAAFRKGDRYWLLKKNAPYFEYQAARNFPLFKKPKNKSGFIAEPRSKRVNPYGMLAYRTIGLWRENAANIGLEQKYDSILSGKKGTRIIRRTTGATWVPVEGSEIDPVHGLDIVTTIDINIQDAAEHALLDVLTKNNCQYGTAIVMEVKTGKIRAMANLGRQADGSYWEDYNYALIPTEPGSTFKLMSLYAVLEDGYKTINDNVNAQGGVAVFGNQRVVDDHKGLGNITIKKAFAQSSNVAFAKLVWDNYQKEPMKFIKHLQKLHLHERTGIDLLGEGRPLIKTTESKSWNKFTSLPWIGYGYESLVTPLHTCMVYNAVANGGKLMKPYLVSAIKEYGLTVKEIPPTVLEENIGSANTVKQLQMAMRAVVEEGTARGIKSPFYTAAGKTGTAQVADKGITYKDGVRQGSFVGYFPYENPQYTIAVVVRSTPHGSYYGAVVGAPVFKTIADKLYAAHIGGWKVPADSLLKSKAMVAKKSSAENLFNVMSVLGINKGMAAPQQWSSMAILQTDSNGKLALQKINVDKNAIPDVSGMGLRDALQVLETAGLNVSISGNGKVITQSLPPGNKIVKGQKIHLQLG
jgi:cell division protein FtsI (penicillin-binding protein 3)